MKRILYAVLLVLLMCLLPQTAAFVPIEVTVTASPTRTLVPTATTTKTLVPTNTPRVVTPTPSPTPTFPAEYEVKEGDTVIAIADRFGIPWGYLADQNNLGNPDLVYQGQILTIPPWPPKTDGREVYVILSEQKAYAVENGKIIRQFVVSTGTTEHPTVTGRYQIYVKYRFDDMSGPGYYIRDVPYVMYFFQGYGLHGTFWHDNFGVPMSHGCVNFSVKDAEWLFGWASVGTPVVVVE